jgi:hypothetical protein
MLVQMIITTPDILPLSKVEINGNTSEAYLLPLHSDGDGNEGTESHILYADLGKEESNTCTRDGLPAREALQLSTLHLLCPDH